MGYGCEWTLLVKAPVFGLAGRCRTPEIPFAAAYRALTSRVKMGPRGRPQLDHGAMEAQGNAAARHGFMSSFARA
jgi:hypothetical protein